MDRQQAEGRYAQGAIPQGMEPSGSDMVLHGGVMRPVCNSLGQPLADTPQALTDFWDWFDDSAAVDAAGRPLVLFHGSGNLASILEDGFRPELTGRGNDQFGSGFYFTSLPKTASAYCTAMRTDLPHDTPRLGGDDAPGVVAVYLRIRQPIRVDGEGSSLSEADTFLNGRQACQVLLQAPGIMDPDKTPLRDWLLLDKPISIRDVQQVAQHYTNVPLDQIEGDFFRGHAGAFREAVHAVTGCDGVCKTFPADAAVDEGSGKQPEQRGEQHWVAWFAEQIAPALGQWQIGCMREQEQEQEQEQVVPLRERMGDRV